VQHVLVPKQTWSAFGHVPQLRVPPHPSLGDPHWPDWHVFFGHTEQTLPMHDGVEPLHVPQWSVPPHPSAMSPQFFPCASHVVG